MQLEVSIDRDPGRTANDAHHRGVLPSTSSSESAQPHGYLAACGKNSQLLLVSSNSCPCPLSPWSSTRQFHHLFPRKEICRSSFLVLIILNPLVLTRTLEYYAQLRTRSVLDKSCRRVRPPAWLTQASSMHRFQRPTYSPRTVGRGKTGRCRSCRDNTIFVSLQLPPTIKWRYAELSWFHWNAIKKAPVNNRRCKIYTPQLQAILFHAADVRIL